MSFDNDPNLFFLFPAVSGEASCVVVLALLVGSIDYDKLFRYGFQANCWISHVSLELESVVPMTLIQGGASKLALESWMVFSYSFCAFFCCAGLPE